MSHIQYELEIYIEVKSMDDEMEINEQDVITQARDMYIHKDIYFPESCGVTEVGEDFWVEAYVRVPKNMVPPPYEYKAKDIKRVYIRAKSAMPFRLILQKK